MYKNLKVVYSGLIKLQTMKKLLLLTFLFITVISFGQSLEFKITSRISGDATLILGEKIIVYEEDKTMLIPLDLGYAGKGNIETEIIGMSLNYDEYTINFKYPRGMASGILTADLRTKMLEFEEPTSMATGYASYSAYRFEFTRTYPLGDKLLISGEYSINNPSFIADAFGFQTNKTIEFKNNSMHFINKKNTPSVMEFRNVRTDESISTGIVVLDGTELGRFELKNNLFKWVFSIDGTESEVKFNLKMSEEEKLKREEIEQALAKREYFIALQLYNELNHKDNGLLTKINTGWLPQKDFFNELYSSYINEFNQIKKQYDTASVDFTSKYQNDIKSKEISINGKDAYAKRIASTSNPVTKVFRENLLNQDGYVYTKKNNKHLICPVGVWGNYFRGRYNEQIVNKLNIKLLYDTSANTYVPFIQFYKNENHIVNSPILNTSVFQIEYFLMPLPTEISALYEKVTNESGRNMLESLYPQKMLYLNSNEPIVLNGLSALSYPGEGIINDKYEFLKTEFENVRKDVEMIAKKREIFLRTNNFYNPSILYLIKKIYPNADSLVFVIGDYKETLGKLGLHIPYKREYGGGPRAFGSFVPLTKGKVELKGDELVVYEKSGNYKRIKVNKPPNGRFNEHFNLYKRVIDQSKISLTSLDLNSLNLDSSFIRDTYFGYKYDESNWIKQYPIYYQQYVIGFPEDYKILMDNKDYDYNDNLSIQFLPMYNVNKLYKDYSTRKYRPVAVIYPAENILFRLGTTTQTERPLKLYFTAISKYFQYKNEGNSKKAMKSMARANKYIEELKKL